MYLTECRNTGSMSKAAEKLNTYQPIISKAIRHLEEYTGDVLIYRLAQGVKLSKNGEILCKKGAVLYDFEHYLDNFISENKRANGNVTLWTTDGFGSWCVPSKLEGFYQQNPNISLDIICSEELPDMERGEADVGVVYEKPTSNNSSAISKHVMKFGLCASKKFVEQYGYPENLNDLINNFKICNRSNFTKTWKKWNDIISKAKKVVISTNSSSVFMRVAKDGMGISLQPKIIINSDDDLVEILPEFKLEHDFWIVSHVDTKDFPKIRTLIDYIKEINALIC